MKNNNRYLLADGRYVDVPQNEDFDFLVLNPDEAITSRAVIVLECSVREWEGLTIPDFVYFRGDDSELADDECERIYDLCCSKWPNFEKALAAQISSEKRYSPDDLLNAPIIGWFNVFASDNPTLVAARKNDPEYRQPYDIEIRTLP